MQSQMTHDPPSFISKLMGIVTCVFSTLIFSCKHCSLVMFCQGDKDRTSSRKISSGFLMGITDESEALSQEEEKLVFFL